MRKNNKYYKYELVGVIGVLIVLAGIMLPRFLRSQTTVQIKTIQQHLDQMVERMMENPTIFIDLTMKNENEVYADQIPYLEMKGAELSALFPEIDFTNSEKDRTFCIEGGYVGPTKAAMKKRKWNWEVDCVTVYTYVNRDRIVRFKVPMGSDYLLFPPVESIYNPSNGVGSEGILYAHSYEKFMAKKKN